MTTIVAVRKNGYAAIAADSLTSWGNIKESAVHVVNHEKILAYKENYIGFTGSSANKLVFEHWLTNTRSKPKFDSVQNIFDSWLSFHQVLKSEYFIREYDEENDPFESSRMNLLIANPSGIFSVGVLRTVLEYNTFTAFGSGFEVSLGAMRVLYDDESLSAESVARKTIEIAAEFDDGTALPMHCYTVKLR
ncbi:MAG: hypothetical protein WBC19_13420 [Pyrinomonadaceae bacterium]|nr:hypothetical protein [Chloracidobacterium sp.]